MARRKGEKRVARPRAATDVDQYVGHRIKIRRKNLGVAQAQLATKLGVSRRQVQKYEDGLNRLSVARLTQVAAALEAPLEWFFRGLPGQTPNPTKEAVISLQQLGELLAETARRSEQSEFAAWMAAKGSGAGRNARPMPSKMARKRRA